jgi:hypothetical protein
MKKTLSAAVLAATMGTVGVSGAVNLGQAGVGEALIYPYYTVRGDQITVFEVVNTTDRTKAVKVRFREGKAAARVLEFNLYLSPFDVWTATLAENGSGAQIRTIDTSCTVPNVLGLGPVAFRNFEYENDAVADDSLNRTREGYFEVIEMGSMDPTSDFGVLAVHEVLGLNDTGPAYPLDWNGSECTTLEALWNGGLWASTDPNTEAVGVPMLGPQGGLFGTALIVNVQTGTMFSYTATALDNWRDAPIHSVPASASPTLADADPVSTVLVRDQGDASAPTASLQGASLVTDFSDTSNGADAVSSLILSEAILNSYALDEGLLAQTDWVFTFPTKHHYVPADGSAPSAPFSEGLTPEGACEPVDIFHYDREEQFPVTPPPWEWGQKLSPRPPNLPSPPSLCWAVSTFEWDNESVVGDGVLRSELALNFVSEFEHGWGEVAFIHPENVLIGVDPGGTLNHRFSGLPVLGFAVTQYINNDVGGLLANFTGLFNHKAAVTVEQTEQDSR